MIDRPVRTAALAVVAVVALAACGGSKSTKTASQGSTTSEAPATTTTTAAAATGSAVVTTKTDAKLGLILADAQGKTLYTLTNNGNPVPCTGQCATAWPPLTLPSGVTTPTAQGVTGLTAVAGPSGEQQVAYQGKPLYRFSKDQDSGDAYGEGISSFGGTWHVVKVQASAGAAGAASTGAGASTGASTGGMTPTTAARTTATTSAYRY